MGNSLSFTGQAGKLGTFNSDLSWLTHHHNKSYPECPKCRKGKLDVRVRRGWFVKTFLGWLPLRHYKCSYCGHRVYITTRQYRKRMKLAD